MIIERNKISATQPAQAAQGAGEVVYQIKGDVFQCPHAWRDADEETFHMVPAKDRRIVYTTPSQPAPVVPEGADGLIRIIGDALLNAHDHLEMHSLEISHCKSAAIIREGLAALASYIKHRNFATTPTPPAQAAADARDAVGHVRIDSGEVHFVPRIRNADASALKDGDKLYAGQKGAQ